MKRFICISALVLCGMITISAQTIERLYVQTDKDFYLSGEKIYLSIYGTDGEKQPLDFSRVAYVELLGDAYNAVRVKVALDKGRGYAVVNLPFSLSSGIYELVAYTRWMRNEGEAIFCRKPVAIFNSLRYSNTMDRLEFVDSEGNYHTDFPVTENLKVHTEKSSYGSRESVKLILDSLPDDADVSVSVVREDMYMPLVDWEAYQNHTPQLLEKTTEPILPELEGMIIESRFVPLEEEAPIIRPNLSIKGKDLHYYAGQVKENNHVFFYTPLLENMKELVASVESKGRLEITSPFVATPPQQMQVLHLYKNQEKRLLERCMQVQTDRFYANDSIFRKDVKSLFRMKPFWSYDLDEYRRFNTFEETFLEFMPGLSAITRDGHRYIMISEEITGIPNYGNTLVFLDGVVMMDHDKLLKYNPYFVKWIDVYVGQYVFGDQLYSGIVVMRTPNHWMPNFQLPENSVVVEYEGVSSNEKSIIQKATNNMSPDLRHTLYWNPKVTSCDKVLEFRTSDLCGTYVIRIEGLTKSGKRIAACTSFDVIDK